MTIPPRCTTYTPPFKFEEKLKSLNKNNFEIVISRYDENIDWSNNYKNFRTIYNKGKDDIESPYIKLDNKGHLADTILKHIINNYNNLSDVTFFTHGSFNYRDDQIIKETGNCHRFFKDFIKTEKNTLVYIPRNDLPDIDYKFHDYHETIGEVHKHIFGSEYIPNFKWACGKWISVSKEIIRKTPVETYQKILDFILKDYENKEPTQHIYRTRGLYIERLILKCFL